MLQSDKVRRFNLFLITFFGCSLFVYLLMNGGAFWQVVRYQLFLRSPFASDDLKLGDILDITRAAEIGSPIGQGGYELVVPKISVTAPIAVPQKQTKEDILASLEDGVGLYPGSVSPGENGRVILLGHSSRASWYRGNYATIFSLLPQLTAGDIFYIVGGGKKYTYHVLGRQVLPPAEASSLLNTSPPTGEVDLVTCYPIGSASKRTIVQAELTSTENL